MTDAEVWLFDEDYVRKAVSSLMRGHLLGLGLQKLSLGLPVLLSSGTIKEIENCRGQKGLEHTVPEEPWRFTHSLLLQWSEVRSCFQNARDGAVFPLVLICCLMRQALP